MATTASRTTNPDLNDAARGNPSASRRLLSLDVLRGLTIAFMIMVNNNGGPGSWKEMNHAAWNGFTATDLVFPTFLFVVGVSLVFSTAARLRRGESRASLARHTLIRAVVLILFGIVVNNFPYFHWVHMRFYGVLQRIGICYLIVGLFYLWDRRVWTKVALLFVTLIGYWILVRWVPVPGAGMPVRDVPLLDRNQNIVAWTDRQLMPGHLYEDRPTHDARDPEGLLSDIPAIGTALLGLLTGLWLASERSIKSKAFGLAAGAAICLAGGYFWSIWFPLNKKMWTSSYVLVAAGWSLAIFALAFWLVEQRGWGKSGWTKVFTWAWLIFGSNAIAAYMISELLPGTLSFIHLSDGTRSVNPLFYANHHFFNFLVAYPGWRAFAYSVSYTFVCFLPVWVLYRKKIFLKI